MVSTYSKALDVTDGLTILTVGPVGLRTNARPTITQIQPATIEQQKASSEQMTMSLPTESNSKVWLM